MILCSNLPENEIRNTQTAKVEKPQTPKSFEGGSAYRKWLAVSTEISVEEVNDEKKKSETALTAEVSDSLKKYARMLKMRIPEVAVRNKMLQDGVDPKLFFKSEKKAESQKPKFRDSLIWQSVLGFDDLQLDASPDLFDSSNTSEAPPVEKKKSKKRKFTTFIQDQKLSQQVHLIVGSLKQKNKTLLDIQRGIWSLSTMPIPLESFVNLKLSQEVIDAAMSYTGPFDDLDNASKMLFALRNIPNLTKRLEMWSFAKSFDQYLEGTREHIDVVREALLQIQSNKKLHIMLNLCCQVLQKSDETGSYEHGFPLHKLFTLSRRKIANSNKTWLQHICSIHPDNAQDFIEEMKLLSATLKYLDLDSVGGNIKRTLTKLKNCAEQLERYPVPRPDRRCRDNFATFFTNFLNRAFPEVLGSKERYSQLLKITTDVAVDLGEPSKVEGKINTEFIKILNNFREETTKAMMLNEQERAKQRRKSMTAQRNSGGKEYFRFRPER